MFFPLIDKIGKDKSGFLFIFLKTRGVFDKLVLFQMVFDKFLKNQVEFFNSHPSQKIIHIDIFN